MPGPGRPGPGLATVTVGGLRLWSEPAPGRPLISDAASQCLRVGDAAAAAKSAASLSRAGRAAQPARAGLEHESSSHQAASLMMLLVRESEDTAGPARRPVTAAA